MDTHTDQQSGTQPAARPSPCASRQLIAIVFCGIGLRLLLLLFRAEDLTGDPDHYVALAKTVMDSGGFCQPDSITPTANKSPLYPLLLASLMWTGVRSAAAVFLINLCAAVALIIATWWIARIAGLRGPWPAAAAVAAGMDPLLLLYSVQPMTEVLSGALITAAILNSLKVQHDDAAESGRARLMSAVKAGICFGLAGLCRPVALVTCAAVAGLLLFGSFRSARVGRSAAGRISVYHATAVVWFAGILLAPWVFRNAVEFGSFIPATTHGGYTLLLGNNDTFFDEVVLAEGHPAWQHDSRQAWQWQLNFQMSRAGVPRQDEQAVDRWYYGQALQVIRSRRADFLRACVLRWKRFWALRPSVDSGGTPRELTLAAAAWFAVLWAGLAGSLFCGIRHRPDIQMLWLAILSFLLVHTFYWTNARMRAPLTGVIVVLAAIGWRHWLSCLARNRDALRGPPGEPE